MTQPSIPLPIALRKSLEQASPDLLRELLRMFLEKLMSNEADSLCGADYGERAEERVNSRNGYRIRPLETRVGEMALRIPRLRKGSYLSVFTTYGPPDAGFLTTFPPLRG